MSLQNNQASAEMMKFLLEMGADPDPPSRIGDGKTADQRGAKGISKWLGISWEELVEQTQHARMKKQEEDNVEELASD
jgi:hypothetical protein